MLLHDVIVVEQPIRRRSSVNTCRRRREQSLLRIGQNASRCCQPREEARRSEWRATRDQTLLARDGACPCGEVVRAEQIAADWARQQFVSRFSARPFGPRAQAWFLTVAVISDQPCSAHQTRRTRVRENCRDVQVHELSLEELGSPRRLSRALLRRAVYGHPR